MKNFGEAERKILNLMSEGTEFIFTLPIRCIDSKNKIDLGMKAHSDIKKCDVEFSDIYAI